MENENAQNSDLALSSATAEEKKQARTVLGFFLLFLGLFALFFSRDEDERKNLWETFLAGGLGFSGIFSVKARAEKK